MVHGQMPTRQMCTGQMLINKVGGWINAHQEIKYETKQNFEPKVFF